jgi:hypothetical protein
MWWLPLERWLSRMRCLVRMWNEARVWVMWWRSGIARWRPNLAVLIEKGWRRLARMPWVMRLRVMHRRMWSHPVNRLPIGHCKALHSKLRSSCCLSCNIICIPLGWRYLPVGRGFVIELLHLLRRHLLSLMHLRVWRCLAQVEFLLSFLPSTYRDLEFNHLRGLGMD